MTSGEAPRIPSKSQSPTPHLSSDFVPLLETFGLYFQIRDDLANLKSDEVSGGGVWPGLPSDLPVYLRAVRGQQELLRGHYRGQVLLPHHPQRAQVRVEGSVMVMRSVTHIHSFTRSDPKNHQLVGILKQRTADVDLKRYCLSIMERTGSFKYTVRQEGRGKEEGDRQFPCI